MAHKHKAVKSVDRCYTGPVVVENQNPMAHGGICIVDMCDCGAVRRSNSNGGHVERGAWHRED